MKQTCLHPRSSEQIHVACCHVTLHWKTWGSEISTKNVYSTNNFLWYWLKSQADNVHEVWSISCEGVSRLVKLVSD